MGNLCSWCLKSQDSSHTNGTLGDYTNSERLSENTDRTPLLGHSNSRKNLSMTSALPNSPSNGESTSYPPLLSPLVTIHEPRTDSSTNNVLANETAETKMAFIVEGMLSKLIDVGNGGSSGIHRSNSNGNGFNSQNDHLRQILTKSLTMPKTLVLPDAGLNNLPSLLSGRPISSDICHFVTHTAADLSHLLIEEIKIVHKEDLVVVFE
ncbi:unnamed protein product [Adineta ricciae]|uniref:Uncharacterized protein n=1 Tax=Adineta ricciae TaxID=249248 RepID=A0A813MV24_ADIRI|nr:unnamed protein product [Adineta ricciae]CAF0993026.1 unnamed protein product [Adineta ricciae]